MVLLVKLVQDQLMDKRNIAYHSLGGAANFPAAFDCKGKLVENSVRDVETRKAVIKHWLEVYKELGQLASRENA